jgi:hypothetical protein
MRESIGTTWTFGLVISFIFIFTCFLTLSISYSKAYKMKNETISILEKYQGYTDESKIIIDDYLTFNGYKGTGACPVDKGWYGASDINKNGYVTEVAESGKKYYYCIRQDDLKDTVKYEIKLFYHFDLPIIGNIRNFDITGNTLEIKKDSNYLKLESWTGEVK